MLIKVIVGHPYSDIGKGWLTSSLGAHLKEPLLFKVDPALIEEMPLGCGVLMDGEYVTFDAEAYTKKGACVFSISKYFHGQPSRGWNEEESSAGRSFRAR